MSFRDPLAANNVAYGAEHYRSLADTIRPSSMGGRCYICFSRNLTQAPSKMPLCHECDKQWRPVQLAQLAMPRTVATLAPATINLPDGVIENVTDHKCGWRTNMYPALGIYCDLLAAYSHPHYGARCLYHLKRALAGDFTAGPAPSPSP